MDYDRLSVKQQQLEALRPLPPELVRNLDHWLTVELTYTSNALEGNTLTRRETAVVIEKGLTIGGKSVREHLETTNHVQALDYIRTLVTRRPSQLVQQDILTIHALVLQGIDDANAGRYRTVPVRIAGSSVILPNPRKVPEVMKAFHVWLTAKHPLHPVAFAGEAHYRLVTIHPFVDGNGRTARLLMNLLLLMRGYPPAIIHPRERVAYLDALETAQLGGSKAAYETIIVHAVHRSLDLYLRAARGESALVDAETDGLLKIGALAKAVGESVPTIRHWTKEQLLQVAQVTDAGYQLYARAMIDRCRHIQHLKSTRLTLKEIQERIRQGGI